MQAIGSVMTARNSATYYGDRPEWLIAFAQHRDSDPLEASNFRVALARLDPAGDADTVAVERAGHFLVGWVEYLLIDPADTARIDQATEMLRHIEEGYPILNEENFYLAEHGGDGLAPCTQRDCCADVADICAGYAEPDTTRCELHTESAEVSA